MQKLSTDIDEHISKIKSAFDTDRILAWTNDTDLIAKYFRLNRLSYGLLHSRQGAVHLLMNDENSQERKFDPYAQAKMVANHIELYGSKSVLELGAGKGINITYLANKFPNAKFEALDLPNGQFKTSHFKKYHNISASYGDFNDLSKMKDGSFDLIYIIEAFMYAKNPAKFLKEINRILSFDGKLIIIQDHLNKPLDKLNNNERLAVELIHASVMSGLNGRYYPDLRNCILKAGFTIEEEKFLEYRLQPGLRILEKKASLFLKFPVILKLINKIVPLEITGNIIICYLLRPIFTSKIHCYALTVAGK